MGPRCVLGFLLLCVLTKIVTAEYGYNRLEVKTRKTAEIDALIEEVSEQTWKPEDAPCFRAFQEMLHGVKNSTLWATWMWDSMQRPTGSFYGSRYHLGSFDQCLNPPWRKSHQHLGAKYCVVDMSMTHTKPNRWTRDADPYDSAETYVNTTSKYDGRLNKATLGLCLPTVCSGDAAISIALLMMRATHLPEPQGEPVLLSCQKSQDTHQYSAGFYFFIIAAAFIVTVAIFGTLFPEYVPPNYVVSEIRLAYDIKRNWEKLFGVSSRELQSVHGLRSINAIILICTHYVYYTFLSPVLNPMQFERDIGTSLGMFLLHIDVTVDTFFALSGMLLVTGLMSGKRTHLMEGLVKRYIRIVGPLLVMVIYFSWVNEHIGSGPLWEYYSGQQRDLCHKNWWATLFMLNNYVNDDQICHTVTWYLSCDFQLAVFGTFLYYLYQRDQKIGKIIIILTAVAAVLTPSIVTYIYKFPPMFFHGINGFINFKTEEVFLKRYIKTYCRAAAYMVGMLMGYIFSTYKPEECKNKLSKSLSIMGFLASVTILVTVYRTGGLMFFREYNVLEAAAFAAFNRATWAVGVCGVIAVCEYGTLPLVSALLKWKVFTPLSRLSYGLYLIHMAVIYYINHGARSGVRYDFVAMVIQGLGIWLVVNLLSLLLYLAVEAPVSNLSVHLFSKRTQVVENGKAQVNGNHTNKIKSS